MRTSNFDKNNILAQITYPDERVFAFNPNYVNFNVSGAVSYVEVVCNGVRIKASLYNGKASVDISRLLQLGFDEPRTSRVKNVTVQYMFNGVAVLDGSFNVQVIWGSSSVGERLNTIGAYSYNAATNVFERHLRYFVNYPQVVQVFNGTDFQTLTVNFENLPQKVYDFSDYMNTVNDLVWDDTFDVTFKKTFTWDNVGPARIVLHRDNETEGYFLRWIDNLGYMQYYLFTKNKRNINVTSNNERNTSIIANGGYYGGGKQTNKSKNISITCAAATATKEDMIYLPSIVTSPIVDLYIGVDKNENEIWLPINVESTNYEYVERKEIQVFEIKFDYPISAIQSL